MYLYIFVSMRRIFITRTRWNRELSICDRVRKILRLVTKICMVFFGVFLCFAGIEAENRRGCIYRGPWCGGPHKLLVQCGPYKRILSWSFPDFEIRNTLTPCVYPDFIIRTSYFQLFYRINEHLWRKLKHNESLNNIYYSKHNATT